MAEPPDLVDVAEALATLQAVTGLRISRRSVNRWAANGTIPTHSFGPRQSRLMLRSAVVAFGESLRSTRRLEAS